MTTRRSVLAGLAATGLMPGSGWASAGSPVAITSAMRADGSHALIGLDEAGAATFSLPIPARGHAAAAHPFEAEAVAMARRPGTFAKVLDCASGQVHQTLRAPQGRHFYGHAAFSDDGTWLFTTENDSETGLGKIGVWDRTRGYARIAELSSGGIGPHEILRLPGGRLAVANGGIRTHPAKGRAKLNLATMRPNLTILSHTGDILDQVDSPAPQNSLRHIAVQTDGTILCGFQWQGDAFETPWLLAAYDGTRLTPLAMDPPLLRTLSGYIGSLSAFGVSSFAATSPRGGRALIVRSNGDVTLAAHAPDVCGVAVLGRGANLATDGTGRVHKLTASALTSLTRLDVAFDNHLVPVRVD